MQIGKHSFNGHRIADFLVLVVLTSFVSWYFMDTYKASAHLLNLILVLPVTLIVLTLCFMEFLAQVFGKRSNEESRQLESPLRVVPIISLFTIYVLTLKWLGFDVGTALFVTGSLRIHGERRWHWSAGYAICFALLVSLMFSQMLPYPMPMLVLPSSY